MRSTSTCSMRRAESRSCCSCSRSSQGTMAWWLCQTSRKLMRVVATVRRHQQAAKATTDVCVQQPSHHCDLQYPSILCLCFALEHLAMEDLTWGRKWPCIMDVKVGTRSYENDATPEKIAYEKQKFPLQEDVGFRIQGIKVFDPEHQRHVEYDKHFGRTVRSRDDLVPAFGRYFATYGGSETKINIALLKTVSRCFANILFSSRR